MLRRSGRIESDIGRKRRPTLINQRTEPPKRQKTIISADSPALELENSHSLDGVFTHAPEAIVEGRAPVAPSTHFLGLRLPSRMYPRSHYHYLTNKQALTESEGLARLLGPATPTRSQSHHDEFEVIDVSDFEVYVPREAKHDGTLIGLETLNAKRGVSSLMLDGRLNLRRTGQTTIGKDVFVQSLRICTLSLDGYGDLADSSAIERIWVQSNEAKRYNIWYSLRVPSPAYERFFKPFVWLVDFARHFTHYLECHPEAQLRDFRQHFHLWLEQLYRVCETRDVTPAYSHWRAQCPRTDYSVYVCGCSTFLWNQAVDVFPKLQTHPIWREFDPLQLRAVPQQPLVERNTVVTRYVFKVFHRMYFAAFLIPRDPAKSVGKKWLERTKRLGFMQMASAEYGYTHKLSPIKHNGVAVGDVVAVKPDEQSDWKDTTDLWLAYVQATRADPGGKQALQVLWLYRPADTSCGSMFYPFGNELFMSDNCNCDDKSLFSDDIEGKIDVHFILQGCQPTIPAGLTFVRQCYLSEDASFVTLRQSHLSCDCAQPKSDGHLQRVVQDFRVHDTALVRLLECDRLEPCVIKDIDIQEARVTVQKLLRRQELADKYALDNELVLADNESTISVRCSRIIRQCFVKLVSVDDRKAGKVPAPYCYGGAADCWILSGVIPAHGSTQIRDLVDTPAGLNLISELALQSASLDGLGLFSGGGSFDRGLSEGSGVRFKWAVEWNSLAAHTYRANAPDDDLNLFCGSVNDHLAAALKGSSSALVPSIGEVKVVSGGSPCQGVSAMQTQKLSTDSCRNTSMVASLVSYIDLYRPAYAIMENVLTLCASNHGPDKNENVFRQVVCALVGMGYQVQQFNVDAWSHNSPQSRSRVFIVATAPGLTPLDALPNTHASPLETKRRSLGRLSNGRSFGDRQDEYTPFPLATAARACKDIPLTGDGAVETCVFHPDHVVVGQQGPWQYKSIYRQIPKFPAGQGWFHAIQQGTMPKAIKDFVHERRGANKLWTAKTNHAYRRVYADRLMPTILTHASPSDSVKGRLIHWRDDRPLTILEARRAQSIPDHEVLLGPPASRWKIVGNGVPRTVAAALGVALRAACQKNQHKSTTSEVHKLSHVREDVGYSSLADKTAPETTGLPITPSGIHLSQRDLPSSSGHSDAITPTSTPDSTRLPLRVETHSRRSPSGAPAYTTPGSAPEEIIGAYTFKQESPSTISTSENDLSSPVDLFASQREFAHLVNRFTFDDQTVGPTQQARVTQDGAISWQPQTKPQAN